MNVSLFIARRYLFSRKSHNAINWVTWISVSCVAVVTAALIIILSAMNGLTGLVESLYNSFHPDVRITAVRGKTFAFTPEQLKQLRNVPGVVWLNEIAEESALAENDGKQMIVTLRGVTDDYAKNCRFDTVVRQGSFDLYPQGYQGAIPGREISARLGLGFMSPVKMYMPRRDRNLAVDLNNLDETPFREELYFVSGFYAVSNDFDGKYVIVPIASVRKLLDYTNECTSVEMGLKPGSDANAAIAQIQAIAGKELRVQNRYQQNEILFRTLQSEKLWTSIILLFILSIAMFNTIGSLTLLIIEKKKDIGVLWSMGADNRTLRRIFFTEGLLISTAGVVIGLLLGLLVVFLQHQFGLVRFDEGFVVESYPVEVRLTDILLITAAVTGIGLLAAWYPVRVYTRRFQTIRFNG
ncbi:MAG: FtsX-like permease family protein [Bacteroidia bacterium]|jgi:ABC-type lipoprotein release transport system permease subunit|nr:FtsX-like permease family protein [Bacteroidia bacterium]